MSQYRYGHQRETYFDMPALERPILNDVQDNTEVGLLRRSIGRYLFSRNPERSIKMYSCIGMPLLHKAIMGTYGHFFSPGPVGNYRTDHNKTMIERSMRFAVGGSVFNEAVHTAVAAWNTDSLIEGHSPTVNAIAVAANTALVGLQRYNRARMSMRINEELNAGHTFDQNYKNWLGMDSRAIEKYKTNHTSQALEQAADPSKTIEIPTIYILGSTEPHMSPPDNQ